MRLDGLNVLTLGAFDGNVWAGAKAAMGVFFDERAEARQREALQMIFSFDWSGPGLRGSVEGSESPLRRAHICGSVLPL